MPKRKKVLRYKNDFIKDLKDPSTNFQIPEYIIIKEEGNNTMRPPIKPKKYTLNQIGESLSKFIKTTNERFDKLEARIDYIEKSNSKRFDRLEARMDKLEARMDNIEKRLDYNNLKKLPTNKK